MNTSKYVAIAAGTAVALITAALLLNRHDRAGVDEYILKMQEDYANAKRDKPLDADMVIHLSKLHNAINHEIIEMFQGAARHELFGRNNDLFMAAI